MKRLSSLLVVLSVLIAPSSAFALSASDALRGTGEQSVVTRGDFIRAAVQVLGMEHMQVGTGELPYRRVASGLEKYVRIAHQKNALEAFGFDLLLAQGITRGDALRVVVGLTDASSGKAVAFKDVRAGTKEEQAVRVAVEENWMEPLTSELFGVRRKLLGSQAVLLLRKISEDGPSTTPTRTNSNGIKVETPTVQINLKSNQRLMNLPKTQILETIWSMIERDFLYKDNIDVDEAAFKAAEGLVESLGDKYTTFMRPVQAKQFQTQIQGEVTGIGAQVEYVDEILTIVSPIKGSPAEKAGLLPGDQILQVDGVPLAGLSFLEAVEKVRGVKGSSVTLTVRRDGNEFQFTVVRDVISVPEIEITWNGDVAVVEIAQFGRTTEEQLREAMEDIVNKGPSGIIVDLRKNPGGLLSAAKKVVSLFVPRGTPYVEVRSRKTDELQYTSLEQIVPDSIRVAILVDEGSASASEIVAGALQDHDRATIIGSKTFGKGTVQQVLQFNDQSSLKMTIAEWYTPDGRKIDGLGINPDIGVSEVEGRDEPMLKALEILR